jgi:hypothetical protein
MDAREQVSYLTVQDVGLRLKIPGIGYVTPGCDIVESYFVHIESLDVTHDMNEVALEHNCLKIFLVLIIFK